MYVPIDLLGLWMFWWVVLADARIHLSSVACRWTFGDQSSTISSRSMEENGCFNQPHINYDLNNLITGRYWSLNQRRNRSSSLTWAFSASCLLIDFSVSISFCFRSDSWLDLPATGTGWWMVDFFDLLWLVSSSFDRWIFFLRKSASVWALLSPPIQDEMIDHYD